ncbi:MAG: VWA domain-containing protein [Candidatus Acidiferrales bacterium]
MSSRPQGVLQCALPLALACLLCALAWAQEPAEPGPLPPRPGVQPQQAPPPQAKRAIRVRVNEVTAPVTVRDRKDELVLDLDEKDFHIFDNGAEQKIDHFDLGGDPLAVALVVETSSQIQPLIPAIHAAGIVFTQTVMGATGQSAVIGFDDTVEVLQPFTSDQDQVEKAIERIKIGTSGRRLYDALGRAVDLLQHQPTNQRRVALVMAESVDSGSESRLGEVLREAQLSNVSIYTIGLSTTAADLRQQKQYEPHQIGPPGTYPIPTPPGSAQTPSTEAETQSNVDLLGLAIWIVQRASNEVKHQALQVAATATGGRYEKTFTDRSMQNAMDEIGGELHAQYTLTYRPQGDEPSGFHEIKVTVSRPGVKVRTRPGYYLAPGGATNPSGS